MKIAVPTRDGRVDDHFGHCAYYTIFDVIDGKVTNISKMASPEGCGCKSGIAPVLRQMGVVVMLAGNIKDNGESCNHHDSLSSICSSDLHIKHGSVPRAVPRVTVGHEMVGIVEEVGSEVKNVRPGYDIISNTRYHLLD